MGNELIWDAEDYNKSNGSQYRDAKEVIDLISKDLPLTSDMIVIDIGCGSGNVTKMLATSLLPKKIFASDFDAQMVEHAKEKCRDDRIEYFVQDISVPWDLLDERLKKLEGKVDLVWSNRVLHWVSDKLAAVKTITRLLKPGGSCYINITLHRDATNFLSKAQKEEASKYFSFESDESQIKNWNSYFKNCGLSQVNIEFLEKDWVFDNEKQKDQMFACHEIALHQRSKNSFKDLSEEEKARWIKMMLDKINKEARTPYGKDPYTDFDKSGLKMYYEQFRIIGKK